LIIDSILFEKHLEIILFSIINKKHRKNQYIYKIFHYKQKPSKNPLKPNKTSKNQINSHFTAKNQ